MLFAHPKRILKLAPPPCNSGGSGGLLVCRGRAAGPERLRLRYQGRQRHIRRMPKAPKPGRQPGVFGIPHGGVRDLPDVRGAAYPVLPLHGLSAKHPR
jgi:hypothetical protein